MLKKVFPFLFLVLLFLGLLFSVFLVSKRTQFLGKAAIPGVLSLENSYLFASPLVAKAGGEEEVTVTAFVLSDQGLGIAGKRVVLYSSPGLSAQAAQEVTDVRGLASFEATSSLPGEYKIWAQIPGEGQIKQGILVTFE